MGHISVSFTAGFWVGRVGRHYHLSAIINTHIYKMNMEVEVSAAFKGLFRTEQP